MDEPDIVGGAPDATIEAWVHCRRSSCEQVLREILLSSERDPSGVLQALDDAGSLSADDDAAFYWKLAAWSLEDRAIAVAEAWLDDPKLAPEKRQRLDGLLDAIPGYRTFKGLDDEAAAQLIRSGTLSPRPLPMILGFVLEILALAGDVSERSTLLHG